MSKRPSNLRPKEKAVPQTANPKAGLLGLGLDQKDDHKRITTGEQFVLVGGSAETHERMTETTVKTFEELKRRGRRIESVDPRELAEIIHKSTPR